jgi:hypothetical protein
LFALLPRRALLPHPMLRPKRLVWSAVRSAQAVKTGARRGALAAQEASRKAVSDYARRERGQFARVSAKVVGVGRSPASVDCTLRAPFQPKSCRPCVNAAMRACDSESSGAEAISTPMRRMRSACCCPPVASLDPSARVRSVGGIVRPRARAVLTLPSCSPPAGIGVVEEGHPRRPGRHHEPYHRTRGHGPDTRGNATLNTDQRHTVARRSVNAIQLVPHGLCPPADVVSLAIDGPSCQVVAHDPLVVGAVLEAGCL